MNRRGKFIKKTPDNYEFDSRTETPISTNFRIVGQLGKKVQLAKVDKLK